MPDYSFGDQRKFIAGDRIWDYEYSAVASVVIEEPAAETAG